MENGRKEVEERALAVVDEANGLVVASNETYEKAGAFLTGIKAIRKEIGEVFDPIISKAHLAHKEAVGQKKKAEAPLLKAEGIVKPRIAEYAKEQERVRQEEQARLLREAEKKAEEERLAKAEEAEKAGEKEEAEAILNEPDFVPPPVVAKTIPKLEGVSFRKNWKYQIVNDALVPRDFLTVDTIKLGQYARSFKDKAKVAGVTFYPDDGVATGAR